VLKDTVLDDLRASVDGDPRNATPTIGAAKL